MDRSVFVGAWLLVVACFLLLGTSPASAFEIDTGFSEACHETMSGQGAADTIIGAQDGVAISDEVPLPASETWNKLADLLLADLDVDYDTAREKFALVSLVLGARHPDTGGSSVVNVSTSRQMHVYSTLQEEHCLRRAHHDGPEGNRAALAAARTHLRQTLDEAVSYRDLPASEQVITRETFVEFYGEVEMEVWAPAFFAGYALHTFQDCFSHTIRTDTLEQVLHVLNYTEAITEEYVPERDGLPHSRAMDRCTSDAAVIAEAASAASEDFLLAFASMYRDDDAEPLDAVFNDWLSYEPGCTVENNICDSKWLEIAEQGQAGPLVDTPTCSAAGGGQGLDLGLLLFCVLLAPLRLLYPSTSRTNSSNK